MPPATGDIAIEISPDAAGRLLAHVTDVSARMADVRPLGLAIAAVLRATFARNIDQGGRPAFRPLAPNTLASKALRGYPSDPLIGSRALRDSLARMNVKGNVTYVTADGVIKVGTNLPYARFQNDGTKPYVINARQGKLLSFTVAGGGRVSAKRVKHPGIPARPFMVVQAEDWVAIRLLMKQFAAGTMRAAAGKDES